MTDRRPPPPPWRRDPPERRVPGYRPEPPRRRARKSADGSGWKRLVRPLLSVFIIAFLAGSAWLVAIARDLPSIDTLDTDPARVGGIVFLDHEDRVIARRGASHGRALSIDELPPYLVDAVLAVEDRRFYQHHGVDLRGTLRALWANIRAGQVVQGGSTITQQLAKNLFLTSDRTLVRKVQEMILAFQLEARFTKDEILALYLDRVYFGAGTYGVEAAAQRYFGRSATEVSLGEAALLAGLLKAPSRYSPANDLGRAAARATVVLDLMYETGRITEEERLAAAETPIRVAREASSPGAGYFVDWIAGQARELSGDPRADLVVRTTLDVDAQRAAEAALRGVLDNPDTARGATQGAMVALAPDGAVRAMVGGRDYAASQYNRAVLARRQPGSSFKAFVYAAAFEGGLTPDDVRDDLPVSYGNWSPENYSGRYAGPITLRDAFIDSSNVVAVRVAEETGRGHIAALARRLGIDSEIRLDPSMALGAFEVTPIELAGAYTAFANGGLRADPYAIRGIETAAGDVLYVNDDTPGPVVLDARTLTWMRELMSGVVSYGTGRAAGLPGRITGGKTGTTNDNRDAWFAGYVDGMTTAIWVGNDDFSPTERAAGGGPPALIFRAFAEAAPVEPLPAQPRWQPDLPDEDDEDDEERNDPISSFLSRLAGGN
ncbi:MULTISPECIES: transglycosylase domain-containing protein [Hyphobacterium]|uniref:peptidoglycan glycosyltransferase n=1 Tax=Hyphobacterium vulgare TaxID=1736751 RepID=A0ABV6ZWN0_9PROT